MCQVPYKMVNIHLQSLYYTQKIKCIQRRDLGRAEQFTMLIHPRLRGFLVSRTFGANTSKISGKPGQSSLVQHTWVQILAWLLENNDLTSWHLNSPIYKMGMTKVSPSQNCRKGLEMICIKYLAHHQVYMRNTHKKIQKLFLTPRKLEFGLITTNIRPEISIQD